MLRRAHGTWRGAWACLPAVLALAIAGCGQDRGVLARVDGQTITVDRFNEAARQAPYGGAPDSAKQRLLDDLVQRELLVLGARRDGLDQTGAYQNFRRETEHQLLRETLFERLLGGPFPVSEAEIRELYARRAMSTHARLILTYDEPRARMALREAESGESFGSVADRHNLIGVIPPGGDIGFIAPGTLLPPLDDVVRTGPLHRPLGPIHSGDSWFVVYLEARQPEPRPDYLQMRPQLADLLRQAKQRSSLMRMVDRLRAEHQVAVVPGAAHRFMERFRPRATQGDTTHATPPPPSPEERAQVMARYREGAYTLGDAYDEMLNTTGPRPNLSMLPTIESWLLSQTIERAALAEARDRRLLDDPDVRRKLQDRTDNFLLDQYYQQQVIARVTVQPDEARAAFDQHRDAFARLESARIVTVTFRDSADAAALAEQVARSPDLREAAAVAGTGRVREERPNFPSESPMWSRFEGRVMAMSPREIAGPYRVEDGWILFQLIEKLQEAPAFENLSNEAYGRLQNLVAGMHRETRLTVLTDSLRAVFTPVVTYQDRLRRVPWPPEGAGPPGM
jgi:peptidyl-prolyl cis-trans isomerase C